MLTTHYSSLVPFTVTRSPKRCVITKASGRALFGCRRKKTCRQSTQVNRLDQNHRRSHPGHDRSSASARRRLRQRVPDKKKRNGTLPMTRIIAVPTTSTSTIALTTVVSAKSFHPIPHERDEGKDDGTRNILVRKPVTRHARPGPERINQTTGKRKDKLLMMEQ